MGIRSAAVLPTTFGRLSELMPEAAAELAAVEGAAWETADPALLELCRRRVVALLGGAAPDGPDAGRARELGLDEQKLAALGRWERSDFFSPAERAHLAFTEQFVVSVAALSDEHVQDLLRHADARQVYAFASALYVIEMTERLRLVTGAILAEPAGAG
jgi:alkylhydroperoxidase family enzyme